MAKAQSVTGTVTNQVTPATAQRLGDGKVIPVQRPKPKKTKK